MPVNSNYDNTRKLCKDLSNLISLPVHITNSFIKIIANALIHRISEEALDIEYGKLKSSSIDIPYVCTIDIEIIDNDIKINNVHFEEEFKKKVLKAVNTGDSPLVESAEKALIESLKNRYNSLI